MMEIQNMQDQASNAGEIELVVFCSGGQTFSLDIRHVREIRGQSDITPLPHVPDEVLGVMNLRGAVIPVFDLSSCFGLGQTAADERNVIMIAMNESRTIGLLVQSVSEIVSIPCSSIQDAPALASGAAQSHVSGLVQLAEGMSRVIDLPAMIQRRLPVTA
jgi:purine-binding chemotaxis protein CheW